MSTISAGENRRFGSLNAFFFNREMPFGMALMRIVLPWTILVDLFRRWPHVRELYSSDGAPGPLSDNFGFPGFLPEVPGAVAVALFTALIVLLLAGSVGWCTRFSLLTATALYFYFGMIDCMSTITKYTVIATHLLFLLGFSSCGAVWSVDAWLRRRQSGSPPNDDDLRFPVWPQRLAQLLLGFIYFGAALTKMHTPAFFSGDQLMYWMMTYINNQHPLGDLLAQYPLVLSLFGYITIAWETVFLFTVFQPRFKWWVLAIGATFHIMTGFTLGLIIFPAVMIASYLSFVTEAEVRQIGSWQFFRRWFERPAKTFEPTLPASPASGWRARLASAGTFGLTLAVACLLGVEAEHRLDPYQLRGAGGPLSPRELSQEEVERLFAPEEPLRHADKLLAFDLGTTIVGEHLLDRSREFKQGQRFFAQLTLSPPHEDMWIDCVLTEATAAEGGEATGELVPGKLLTKVGQVVPRETFRSNFFFNLDEAFAPGEYFIKLRCGNEEIARRKFTLLPRTSAPAAN